MKQANEIYDASDRYGWDDYKPMLEAIGTILVQVDDEDYQGDSRVLYSEGNRIGFLQFGWGSCSGCDALQGAETIEQVQELMDELVSQIKWFDNKEDALKFFNEHDWEGDYDYHAKERTEFIEKVKNILQEK
jgi:DNA-binding Lrp family transcriptional regulator